jgi:hypothetical protein
MPPRGAVAAAPRTPPLPWGHIADLRDACEQQVLTAPAARRGYFAALRDILDAIGDDRVKSGREIGAALAYIERAVRSGPQAREVP